MRVLLSTIGSRGDVQPMVALALKLREMGQEARICAPPDFREWIGELGISFVPVGPAVRQTAAPQPSVAPPATPQTPPTPEQFQKLMEDTVAGQFEAIAPAARDCDVLVAGMSLQFALHSIAEQMGVPYVYTAWCPVTLPSPHHAPPPLPARVQPAAGTADNPTLWAQEAKRWNDYWAAAINSHRAAAGLAPIPDVRNHIMTDRPWLAADATLAPWAETTGLEIFQTGAWLPLDERPLSAELEAFLDAGEPPVYFGFGSMRAPRDVSQAIVGAAREVGRRAIISGGWGGVTVPDEGGCLCIGEANLQSLFRRVAAVVHHGGAGTTTVAALAGAPQVVVPQIYDQHYWAGRVRQLGIGRAHAPGAPTAESLTEALQRTLQPGVAVRAREVGALVRTDGAEMAARRLIEIAGAGRS